MSLNLILCADHWCADIWCECNMMIHPTVFLYYTLFHLTHELSLGEELFGQHLFLDAFGCVAFDFIHDFELWHHRQLFTESTGSPYCPAQSHQSVLGIASKNLLKTLHLGLLLNSAGRKQINWRLLHMTIPCLWPSMNKDSIVKTVTYYSRRLQSQVTVLLWKNYDEFITNSIKTERASTDWSI